MGQHGLLDKLAWLATSNVLLKAGPVIGAWWWAWCGSNDPVISKRRREIAWATLIGALVAVLLARVAANVMPHRSRPLQTPGLEVNLASFLERGTLDGWSSMPSDHASLFFSLCVGLCFVWPRATPLFLAHAIFVICMPRAFLGLHYFSDLAAGALLGTLVAIFFQWPLLRTKLAVPALRLENIAPGPFYACLFLVTFQIATLFDASRQLIGVLRSNPVRPAATSRE